MNKTKFIHARVTEEQKRQYLALGGTAWLEKMLEDSKKEKENA